LADEEVQAAVPAAAFDVTDLQRRVLLCQDLKAKPLKSVPVKLL
jgi:hypothetical protein